LAAGKELLIRQAAISYVETEFAGRIENPLLREIFAYWQRQRGDRAMPARADIAPMEIPRLLRHVFLIDVIAEPRDYRYRLVGTAISERYGEERTGKLVSEVFAEPTLSIVMRVHDTVVNERRPVRATGPVVWRQDDYTTFETLFLPLSDDRRSVNMIFGGMIFSPRHGPGKGPPAIVFE